MKHHVFHTGTAGSVRQSTAPRANCYGIGIGGDSEHGFVLAGGRLVGPGSPLLLDGSEAEISIETISFLPGLVHVVIATCPAELAALCRPRPAWSKRVLRGMANDPDVEVMLVPFQGRKELVVQSSTQTEPVTLTTRAVHYDQNGAIYKGLLNTYAVGGGYDLTLAYETERCDAIELTWIGAEAPADPPDDVSFLVQAFDEGT